MTCPVWLCPIQELLTLEQKLVEVVMALPLDDGGRRVLRGGPGSPQWPGVNFSKEEVLKLSNADAAYRKNWAIQVLGNDPTMSPIGFGLFDFVADEPQEPLTDPQLTVLEKPIEKLARATDKAETWKVRIQQLGKKIDW